MITPEEIDAKEFTTTRMRAGYDPDEVDSYLDRVIVDYRAALARLAASEKDRYLIAQRLKKHSEAPTTQIPAVYSDMDKLLAVAQQHADSTIGEANGRAGQVLAQADEQAKAILVEAQNERDRILGQLTGKRDTIEQQIAALKDEQAVCSVRLQNALTALVEGQ